MENKENSISKNKSPKFISSLLLMAYGLVAFITPNFNTLDSNGPKFLAFAVLNLVAFLFLFTNKNLKNNFFKFFTTKIGIAYSILMFLSLLSFAKALNISESVLHFAKIFTTFSAAWFISIIVKYDKNAIKPLAITMLILLFVDCFQTFEGIYQYTKGKLPSIDAIKSSYSNKNILTSAIFVKIPFALWLFVFFKKWIKYSSGFVLTISFLAILFLSSRAFYLGTILLFVLLFIHFLIKYKKENLKKHLYNIGFYFTFLVISFSLFYIIQKNFYPNSVIKRDFINRIKSITDSKNESNYFRLSAWENSFQLIKKEPLLGVGLGNWKIRVLKYENPTKANYKYMYKNHNDFIEITAESGIFAGITFISIFLFILWYYAVVLLKNPDKKAQKLLFLPAFGVISYGIDAFFNFPQDRPEIQSLFALYLGIAIGSVLLINDKKNDLHTSKKSLKTIVLFFTGSLLIGSIYILLLNVKSLKLQRIIKDEIKTGNLTSSSSKFITNFPAIPNLNALAEPITVQKARYLINEGKYQKALALLRKDKSNPYDGRKEFFMASAFYKQKLYDSALYYSKITYKLKPLFKNNNHLIGSIYIEKEDDKQLLSYLKTAKKLSRKQWIDVASKFILQEKYNKAKQVLNLALIKFPKSRKIHALKSSVLLKTDAINYLAIYNKGIVLYNNEQYNKALLAFNDFINNVPQYNKTYELRAICYYYLKEYQKALNDLKTAKKLGLKLQPSTYNIEGICFAELGNTKRAKKLFKKAMKLGNENGKLNYLKLNNN